MRPARRHHPQFERAQCLQLRSAARGIRVRSAFRSCVMERERPGRALRATGRRSAARRAIPPSSAASTAARRLARGRCATALVPALSPALAAGLPFAESLLIRCRVTSNSVASTREACIAASGTRSLVVPAVVASCWLQAQARLAVAPRSSCRRVRLNGRPHGSLDPCGCVCIFLVEGLVLEQRARKRIELVPILPEQRNDLLV